MIRSRPSPFEPSHVFMMSRVISMYVVCHEIMIEAGPRSRWVVRGQYIGDVPKYSLKVAAMKFSQISR
jgi:hypothetical protein